MIGSSHYYVQGNLVFAEGPEDVWAGYQLDGQSYPGLSTRRKIELKERLEAFAYTVETDFQVIRLSREWSPQSYVERALATVDRRHGDSEAFARMLEEHRVRLSQRQVLRPEVYLFVRLGGPAQAAASMERLGEMGRSFRRALGLADARGISRKRVGELRRVEERTFDRLYDYVPCERVRSHQVAYLIRSAYTRGIGEPRVDENWRPQALWVEPTDGGDPDEGPAFEPYEHDLLHLHNSRVTIEKRGLCIDSELGTSYQAGLVVGALPETTSFPGGDAELMFSPLEVGFPVDAIYTAEYLPSTQAQKLARKRMVDADQQAKEEAAGDHGPTPQSQEKQVAARELQMRLSGSDRPPLLRSALTLWTGASSAEERERRVERLLDEFGRIELHRPIGEQHRLFVGTMPARRFPISDYKAHLLPEEFGAMVPTAISHAGSEIGPYIGYTLTGSRAPIQFDAAEACAQNRPPTVLLTGSLGSGKTIAMQLLEYQAYLAGSFICDIDPKGGGDHGFLRIPGVMERTQVIELGPEEKYRGLLDPLRVAEDGSREELAYTFLTSILPQPVEATWQTEIRAAVAKVAARDTGTTGEVLDELEAGSDEAGQAAAALRVHLDAGLARLGFGNPELQLPDIGDAQVVALEIRNLTLPEPGTSRSEFQENERVSQAVLALVAAYALRLCARDKKRHAVLALDEAWALLDSTTGRTLLSRISRLGRSQNLTPILASQIIGDSESLEPLVGTYFAFGVETESEAKRGLELLRLDADDETLQSRLIGYRAGRCFMRDFDGLTVPLRVDPGPELLEALDTTPHREEGALPRSGGEDDEALDAVAA